MQCRFAVFVEFTNVMNVILTMRNPYDLMLVSWGLFNMDSLALGTRMGSKFIKTVCLQYV